MVLSKKSPPKILGKILRWHQLSSLIGKSDLDYDCFDSKTGSTDTTFEDVSVFVGSTLPLTSPIILLSFYTKTSDTLLIILCGATLQLSLWTWVSQFISLSPLQRACTCHWSQQEENVQSDVGQRGYYFISFHWVRFGSVLVVIMETTNRDETSKK